MLKKTVRVNEYTDSTKVIETIRDRLTGPDLVFNDLAFNQIEQAIRDVQNQVENSINSGSSFQSTRSIRGDDYDITIVASCGQHTTFIQRILSWLNL